MRLSCKKMTTPIGTLFIAADAGFLRAITCTKNEEKIRAVLGSCKTGSNAIIRSTEEQLREYFDGKRTEFDLPIQLTGTDFQQKSWQTLMQIPYGETRSYSEQAALLGQPNAARAVGTANGHNPISIVVPCHRVIAKSGGLGGYAGGIEIKKKLLDLEKEVSGKLTTNYTAAH